MEGKVGRNLVSLRPVSHDDYISERDRDRDRHTDREGEALLILFTLYNNDALFGSLLAFDVRQYDYQ